MELSSVKGGGEVGVGKSVSNHYKSSFVFSLSLLEIKLLRKKKNYR